MGVGGSCGGRVLRQRQVLINLREYTLLDCMCSK